MWVGCSMAHIWTQQIHLFQSITCQPNPRQHWHRSWLMFCPVWVEVKQAGHWHPACPEEIQTGDWQQVHAAQPLLSSAWISSRNMQWIHSQFPFILYASSVRRCWDVDACEQWVWHQARWHTARGCCGSLWAGVGPTHPHLERIRPFSVPHPLPRVSPSHLGVGRCSCSPQLDVTGIMEPHRAFTLHVSSKPPCTFPSRVFRCKIRSPTWVNEPRLCTCSTCLSVSGQAVLYSCAKNVFHAQLPELCLI